MPRVIGQTTAETLALARRAVQRAIHRIEEAFLDYERAKLELVRAEGMAAAAGREAVPASGIATGPGCPASN
jgi:hypothetical protein